MDDPARQISREVEPPPSQATDPLLYRLVVGFLGAAMMTAILLVGLLSYQGKPGSDLLIAVPSAVVGGLIGMLVPSPVRK
jgi:integral membrane sensor domain MASE1